MNGKGDKRRPSKPGAFEEGYGAIDWDKKSTVEIEGKKYTVERGDIPTPPKKIERGSMAISGGFMIGLG